MSGIIQGLLASISAGDPTFAFSSSAVQGSSGTSKTFSAFGIGAADSQRRVIVVVGFYSSAANTLSSVTVGGQSTSIVVTRANDRNTVAICVTDSPVTSGTTADIVITASGSISEAGIGTYSAINLASTTPTATASTITVGGSQSLTVDKGGILIGVGGMRGFNGEGGGMSFSNISQDFFRDGYSTSVGYRIGAGSHVSISNQSRSVSISMTDEFHPAMAFASFR
jgi:hypothetical protein